MSVRPPPILEIMDHEIDERTRVDINSLRGLEYPRLFKEFDQWFAGRITVDWHVQQSHKVFEILLGHASIRWLGEDLSVVKYYFLEHCSYSILYSVLNCHVSNPPQYIYAHFRLISEKSTLNVLS